MNQTSLMIQALKKTLKANGITYQQLAHALGMSESSIKRIFADENFSLQRLEQICNVIGMDLADLITRMNRDRPRISELTEEQEKVASADTRLLGVAFLVVNGWSFQHILNHYPINQADLVHYLLMLDKLRVIDLEPNNRIKLLISSDFSWRKNGPIQTVIQEHVQKEFLESDFESSGGQQHFLSGMLSQESYQEISQQLKHLQQLVNDLKRQDQHLPIEQRNGFSMAMAVRPWRDSILHDMIKAPL
jgi:transcriptional regulator with XRE-family HTH domain